jgi:nitrite reductase/ring-hydroxylating ferredoxin subunit
MSEARWLRLGAVADLPHGRAYEIRVLAQSIAVFNCSGRFWAVDGHCRHMRARLVEGRLDGVKLTCPWHAWTYDVSDGSCMTDGEAWARLRTYAVKEEKGILFVDAAPIYRAHPALPE